MHRNALGLSRVFRILREQSDEGRAAIAIAAERDELGPSERETHVNVLREEGGAPTGVAGAIQRGVRRDEPDRHCAVVRKPLGSLLEEGGGGERVPRRVKDLRRDLPDEGDRPERSQQGRYEHPRGLQLTTIQGS